MSGDERPVMQAAMQAVTEKRRMEMDNNGDGQADLQEQQAYWPKVALRYDHDADGRLNAEERRQMRRQEDLAAEWWFLAWSLSGATASREPAAATQPGS